MAIETRAEFMGLIAKDLPTLVFMLLPGFIAAGIYYTLTAHPKSSEFERVIQALIFTALLKFFTTLLRAMFLFFGKVLALGTWSADVELAWAILLSLPLGLLFAWVVNNDVLHAFMRRRNLTRRTSHPSEWYSAFVGNRRWVILHLTDRRRLYGWPDEWPDQPDKGHFVINEPEWLLDDNQRAPLYQVKAFVLPASEVKMVEFLKADDEVSQGTAELKQVEQLLINAQGQENQDGSQSPPAKPEPTPPPDEQVRGGD